MVKQDINPLQGQPQAPKIDLKNTKEMACPSCGHEYFEPAIKLRYMSPILSHTGKALVIPVDSLICKKCGTEINDEFVKSFEQGLTSEVTNATRPDESSGQGGD